MIADGQIGLPRSHWSACGLCGLRGAVGGGAGVSDAIFIWGQY